MKKTTDNFSKKVIKLIKKCISSKNFIERHKKNKNDFIRNRSLTFDITFMLLIRKSIKSLQLCINEFFSEIGKKVVTASSFCQARSKLSHGAFIEITREITKLFYKESPIVKLYRGFRLTAVDGSKVYLPDTIEIKKEFGEISVKNKHGKQKSYTGGLLSVLYDVLNNIAIDFYLENGKYNEIALAMKHLEYADKRDLILYDRGYASYMLFSSVVSSNANFVCRCQKNGFTESRELFEEDCKINSKVCTIKLTSTAKKKIKEYEEKYGIDLSGKIKKQIKIRFVRVILDTGEIEVLATSLIDEEKYPTKIFKEIYNKRWGIEIYYDILKNRLNLENFTGKSVESIKQDLFSTILVSNLESILTMGTNEKLKKKSKEKKLKHEQKVNKQVSFNALKNNVIDLLFSNDIGIDKTLEKMKDLFEKNPTLKRKGRRVDRKKSSDRRKMNFHKRRKKSSF